MACWHRGSGTGEWLKPDCGSSWKRMRGELFWKRKELYMARTIGIGHQDFEQLITNDYFYIDKTDFIREWWEGGDAVTLITRPRRFGKTLAMSMVEKFFSIEYAGRGELFQGLSVWNEEKYRLLQGKWPVIFLSFANVKETDFQNARSKICALLAREYARCQYLVESGQLSEWEKKSFFRKDGDMNDTDATLALNELSEYLYRYYNKKVIILLDEYDTPMQEAYVHGYWEEMVAFTRSMFNAAFKTNPWLERAIMTGITRISKESIFSDLNNLKVVTTTSDEYGTAFGFTEEEVFAAMEEHGFGEKDKEEVKSWYDGFIFGKWKDIYNPWSILNFLDTGKLTTYWANTSSNSLVGKLIREGSPDVKMVMEGLLEGGKLHTQIDEQIVFSQLDQDENAIWSMLLVSGYLKVDNYTLDDGEEEYELSLTNKEVRIMFRKMIKGWFSPSVSAYNNFIKALLQGDKEAMNAYMNRVSRAVFSYFDTGSISSESSEPERFYHGFVLGLMVELSDRYTVTSNRESGFGRYDVMLEPLNREDDALIMEFKVHTPGKKGESTMEETVQAALRQIEDRHYAADLLAKGFPESKIRKYGFAFAGKTVLIG